MVGDAYSVYSILNSDFFVMTRNAYDTILLSTALQMNYTVVQYKQDVVVTAVTWEPNSEDTVYSIKAIPENSEDTIIQQLNSPPAYFNLSYNTEYNLKVQDTQCHESVSTRFFQGSSIVSKIVP